MPTDDNHDVKLALEEMRFSMQQILISSDTLDQKVNALLVAAGMILAISATLQISLSPQRSGLYWAILILAVVLYLAAVGFILVSIKPYSYHMAITAKWEELNECIFNRPERDAILALLSGYVEQIQYNQDINSKKAILQSCSIVLLGITVLLVIILVCIP